MKAGLLDLVDHAVGKGWSARAACRRIEPDHGRYRHWLARLAARRLEDLQPGGNPIHGIRCFNCAARATTPLSVHSP